MQLRIFQKKKDVLESFVHLLGLDTVKTDQLRQYIETVVMSDQKAFTDYYKITPYPKKFTIKNREVIYRLIGSHINQIVKEYNVAKKTEEKKVVSLPEIKSIPMSAIPLDLSNVESVPVAVGVQHSPVVPRVEKANISGDIFAKKKYKSTQSLSLEDLLKSSPTLKNKKDKSKFKHEHKDKIKKDKDIDKSKNNIKDLSSIQENHFIKTLVAGIRLKAENQKLDQNFLIVILEKALETCVSISEINKVTKTYLHIRDKGWDFTISLPDSGDAPLFKAQKKLTSHSSSIHTLVLTLSFISGEASKCGIIEDNSKLKTDILSHDGYTIVFPNLTSDLKALFKDQNLDLFIKVGNSNIVHGNVSHYLYNDTVITITSLSTFLSKASVKLELIDVSKLREMPDVLNTKSLTENYSDLLNKITDSELDTLKISIMGKSLETFSDNFKEFIKLVDHEAGNRVQQKLAEKERIEQQKIREKQEKFETIKINIGTIRNLECDLYIQIIKSYLVFHHNQKSFEDVINGARKKFPIQILARLFPEIFNEESVKICSFNYIVTDFLFQGGDTKESLTLSWILQYYTQDNNQQPVSTFEAVKLVEERKEKGILLSNHRNEIKVNDVKSPDEKIMSEQDKVSNKYLENARITVNPEKLLSEALSYLKEVKDLADKYQKIIKMEEYELIKKKFEKTETALDLNKKQSVPKLSSGSTSSTSNSTSAAARPVSSTSSTSSASPANSAKSPVSSSTSLFFNKSSEKSELSSSAHRAFTSNPGTLPAPQSSRSSSSPVESTSTSSVSKFPKIIKLDEEPELDPGAVEKLFSDLGKFAYGNKN